MHRPGLQRDLNLMKGTGLRDFGTVVYLESKYYSIELSVITMGILLIAASFTFK